MLRHPPPFAVIKQEEGEGEEREGEFPADEADGDKTRHELGNPPVAEKVEEEDDQNASPAVIGFEKKGCRKAGTHQGELEVPFVTKRVKCPDGQETAEEGDDGVRAGAVKGTSAFQRQVKGDLRGKCQRHEPSGIIKAVFRVEEALGDKEAENGEGDAPDGTHDAVEHIEIPKRRAPHKRRVREENRPE